MAKQQPKQFSLTYETGAKIRPEHKKIPAVVVTVTSIAAAAWLCLIAGALVAMQAKPFSFGNMLEILGFGNPKPTVWNYSLLSISTCILAAGGGVGIVSAAICCVRLKLTKAALASALVCSALCGSLIFAVSRL